MPNKLVTMAEITANVNAKIPEWSEELGITSEEFVKRLYEEMNAGKVPFMTVGGR